MPTTSTTPEAVGALRSGVTAWGTAARGIAVQLSATVQALVNDAEDEVRRRSAQKAAVEALLRSARDEDRGQIARQVNQAVRTLDAARRALERAQAAATNARQIERRTRDAVSNRVPAATRDLTRKYGALDAYAAVPTAGAESVAPSAGSNFGVAGIVEAPIANATFDANPITDGFTRGGADISDYRWAVETWDTVVRPGVQAGKTREDFERRDLEQGRETGFRRVAGVYDMFLGSDPIHFSCRPDGAYSVDSGRHRVAIARQLGITHLPVRLHD